MKILFVAVILFCFVGVSQTNAQKAVVEHDVEWTSPEWILGEAVVFTTNTRVITGALTINSVYWGQLEDPANFEPRVVVVDAGTHPIYGVITWKFTVKKDGSVHLIAQTKKVKKEK